MSDLEPRVTMLERLHNDNSLTLKAVQTDFHHVTKTLDKIEVTLGKFAEVFGKVDNLEGSISRCHTRIDAVEVRLGTTTTDFTACRATKLDKKDIERLESKLDMQVDKVNQLELKDATDEWRNTIFDRLLYGGLAAIGSGVAVYFFL